MSYFAPDSFVGTSGRLGARLAGLSGGSGPGGQYSSAELDAKKAIVSSVQSQIQSKIYKLRGYLPVLSKYGDIAYGVNQQIASLASEMDNLWAEGKGLLAQPTPSAIPTNFPISNAQWLALDSFQSRAAEAIDQSKSLESQAASIMSAPPPAPPPAPVALPPPPPAPTPPPAPVAPAGPDPMQAFMMEMLRKQFDTPAASSASYAPILPPPPPPVSTVTQAPQSQFPYTSDPGTVNYNLYPTAPQQNVPPGYTIDPNTGQLVPAQSYNDLLAQYQSILLQQQANQQLVDVGPDFFRRVQESPVASGMETFMDVSSGQLNAPGRRAPEMFGMGGMATPGLGAGFDIAGAIASARAGIQNQLSRIKTAIGPEGPGLAPPPAASAPPPSSSGSGLGSSQLLLGLALGLGAVLAYKKFARK